MTQEANRTPRRDGKPANWFIAAAIILFALVVALTLPLVLASGSGDDNAGANITDPTPSPTASEEPQVTTDVDCDPLFEQVEVAHDNNRVDAHFSDIIDEAIAKPGSLDANTSDALLERAGQSGKLLAIWTEPFGLYEDPNKWEELVEDDCLNVEGQDLHLQFETALKMVGTSIAIGEAPSDGTNTGVSDDGVYGVNETPGVTGDRTAIVITLPDGTKVYIMIRCGNIVYDNPPPEFPEVPTDEKKPSESSGEKGNAPDGRGINDDTTEGEYTAPEVTEQPGDEPYVAPAPPAPTPEPAPSSSPAPSPAPVPTADPAPAPTPQPSAPQEEEAPSTCLPPPGKTTC